MVRRRPALRALAAALTLPAAGCSFVFVRPPPDPLPSSGEVECTTSGIAPGLDVLGTLAAASIGAAFGAIRSMGSSGPSGQTKIETALLVGVAAAPFAASSVYGGFQTRRCRTAKALPRRPAPAASAEVGGPDPFHLRLAPGG